MSKYDDDISSTAADIAEDGMLVTYKVVTFSKDSAQPWKGVSVAYTEHAVYIVKIEDKTKLLTTIVEIDGDIKKEAGNIDNNLSVLMPGNVNFIPKIKDIVVIGSDEYKVVKIEAVAPDNVPILYILELTR